MCDCVQPLSNPSNASVPVEELAYFGRAKTSEAVPWTARDGRQGDSNARRIRCRAIRKNATRCTGESSFQ
jgi:hypothetical protein